LSTVEWYDSFQGKLNLETAYETGSYKVKQD